MKKLMITLTIFMVVIAAAVRAETVPAPHSVLELVTDAAAVAPGVPFHAGVRIRLDPDWHTYWINPGEAGMATRVTWDLPPGFSAGPLQWPYPKRFVSDGVVGFGYEDEVLLFAEITPPADLAPGSSARVRAEVDLLLCSDICVPGAAELKMELPVAASAQEDVAGASLLLVARAKVPAPRGDEIVSARFENGKIVLSLKGEGAGLKPPPVFFPEARNLLAMDVEPVWIDRDDVLEGQFTLSHLARGTPLRLRGVLILETGEGTKALQVDTRLKR